MVSPKGFKYGKLTREDLLTMLRMELILVDTGRAKAYRVQRDGDLREMSTFQDACGRYVVRVYWGKKRCGVMRNVLVWMAKHLRVPGEGMDIDHVDENNQNDCIDNLVEVPASLNRALGREEYEKEDFL